MLFVILFIIVALGMSQSIEYNTRQKEREERNAMQKAWRNRWTNDDLERKFLEMTYTEGKGNCYEVAKREAEDVFDEIFSRRDILELIPLESLFMDIHSERRVAERVKEAQDDDEKRAILKRYAMERQGLVVSIMLAKRGYFISFDAYDLVDKSMWHLRSPLDEEVLRYCVKEVQKHGLKDELIWPEYPNMDNGIGFNIYKGTKYEDYYDKLNNSTESYYNGGHGKYSIDAIHYNPPKK